jgi:hypothetical protein
MLGLKSITNRALKAVRDIGSFASDNPLGTSLLGLPFLFGQDGLSVGNLFGKDGFLNQNKGLVSLVTSLIGLRS